MSNIDKRAASSGDLLIEAIPEVRYLGWTMDKPNTSFDPNEGEISDLVRRLARYRMRVAAEGRSRSLSEIDRAIEEAGDSLKR